MSWFACQQPQQFQPEAGSCQVWLGSGIAMMYETLECNSSEGLAWKLYVLNTIWRGLSMIAFTLTRVPGRRIQYIATACVASTHFVVGRTHNKMRMSLS